MIDLYSNTSQLLENIESQSLITSSPYDTAWIARLGELDTSLSDPALDWLRENQLADGSWGASQPRYHHERLICTLAAMIALAKSGKDKARCQRAQLAIELESKGLLADPVGATIGFEMIVPALVDEAKKLGLIQYVKRDILTRLTRQRKAKFKMLPNGMINRAVTVAFSAEMVGEDGLQLLDVKNLAEQNGSIAYSPAATSFFLKHVDQQNANALQYLHSVTLENGSVPYISPIEIFERAWTLWNLLLTEPLDSKIMELCQTHLDFLEAHWQPEKGISACAGLTLIDGDTTGIVYEVLKRFGRPTDLAGVLSYETEDAFRCFPLEANPSISTNIHILGALRYEGFDVKHPLVKKVLNFLDRTQIAQSFWFDKWHVSPYYPTAHAIIICTDYADFLIHNSLQWILETQNPNGSWGYYMPTLEETAYCLQAIIKCKQRGAPIPDQTLRRGAGWLMDHIDSPYDPLWIGKSLYCPIVVVRSAILSALTLINTVQ